ncbi:hypothetical protein PQX77_013583 [Marasmius sp. AFHP31]|nr:hypothetical protein PQX77_013583 [Marasmius sp. AFHP31]
MVKLLPPVAEAQLQSALLAIAFSSVLFPTIFYFIETEKLPHEAMDKRQAHLLALSRGTALVLIFIYGSYLWHNMVSSRKAKNLDAERRTQVEEEEATPDENEAEEEQLMNPKVAVALLVFVTVPLLKLIGVTCEFLVSSINGLVDQSPLSKQFVAFILLPMAGNAAEHASAIMLAWKNRMSMALEIAIGSSIVSSRVHLVCLTRD